MNKQQVGKVTVSYERGEISDIQFQMSLSLQPIVENFQQEIKNKFQSNEKTKLDEASEFILANVFNKITEVELRDFETTKIETDMDCVEEDGVVVECTIVYYLTEL